MWPDASRVTPRTAKARVCGPSQRARLGRSPGAPAFEALDAAAAADGSLLAGVGGMALRADLDLDRGPRRARLERRAAVGAADGRSRQLWMDSGFLRFLSLRGERWLVVVVFCGFGLAERLGVLGGGLRLVLGLRRSGE